MSFSTPSITIPPPHSIIYQEATKKETNQRHHEACTHRTVQAGLGKGDGAEVMHMSTQNCKGVSFPRTGVLNLTEPLQLLRETVLE